MMLGQRDPTGEQRVPDSLGRSLVKRNTRKRTHHVWEAGGSGHWLQQLIWLVQGLMGGATFTPQIYAEYSRKTDLLNLLNFALIKKKYINISLLIMTSDLPVDRTGISKVPRHVGGACLRSLFMLSLTRALLLMKQITTWQQIRTDDLNYLNRKCTQLPLPNLRQHFAQKWSKCLILI